MTLDEIEKALEGYAKCGLPEAEIPALAALVEVHKARAFVPVDDGRMALNIRGEGPYGAVRSQVVT